MPALLPKIASSNEGTWSAGAGSVGKGGVIPRPWTAGHCWQAQQWCLRCPCPERCPACPSAVAATAAAAQHTRQASCSDPPLNHCDSSSPMVTCHPWEGRAGPCPSLCWLSGGTTSRNAGLEHGGQAYLAGGIEQAPALSAPAAKVGLRDGQVHDIPVGWQLRLHRAPEVSAHARAVSRKPKVR